MHGGTDGSFTRIWLLWPGWNVEMELVKLTCPPSKILVIVNNLRRRIHGQVFHYMDKYFNTLTWTTIIVGQNPKHHLYRGLGKEEISNLICVGMITDRDQQWRFRTSETLNLFYGMGIIRIMYSMGCSWTTSLKSCFGGFLWKSFVYSRNTNGNRKIKRYSEGLYLYKSESFNTLRLTGYAQSRIKHKGFGKGRNFEAFYGKNY